MQDVMQSLNEEQILTMMEELLAKVDEIIAEGIRAHKLLTNEKDIAAKVEELLEKQDSNVKVLERDFFANHISKGILDITEGDILIDNKEYFIIDNIKENKRKTEKCIVAYRFEYSLSKKNVNINKILIKRPLN